MMNNLKDLIKVTFIDNFNLNKWFNLKKLKPSKIMSRGLLVIFMLVYIIGYSWLYNSGVYSTLKEYNMPNLLIPIFASIVFIAIIFSSIYKAKTILFNSKDNDMLFAMPISNSIIIANKVINFMIINYLITFVLLIPSVIIHGVNTTQGIIYYIYSIISLIILPIIPTVIASIIGYIFAIILSKVKFKNVVELILNFVLVIGIFLISFNLQSIGQSLLSNVDEYTKIFKYIGYPIYLMYMSIIKLDILSLIINIFLNLAVFILFISLFSRNYKKIINKLTGNSVKSKYVSKEMKSTSVLNTLLKKEFSTFFSIPVYMMNTLFGVIMMFIGALVLVFYNNIDITKVLNDTSINAFGIILLAVTFMVSMSNTASCSVSLEGNRLWILKSLPISEKKIFDAKILLNIIVVAPISIVSVILMSIVLKLTVFQLIYLIVFILLLTTVISYFGILVNLKFPKLEYKSPIHVVKQSMSTFVAIFAPIILLMIIMSIVGMADNIITSNANVIYTSIIAILLIVILIFRKILSTWGIKAFKKL